MTTAHDHDGDLATLVREHVRQDEPPFLLSPDTAIAVGRRTLRRRRARRGLTAVGIAAAASVAVVTVIQGGTGSHGDDRTGIDPATAAALKEYDAQKMPQLIEDHTRAVLSRSVDLGPADFTASDSQRNPLTPKDYDEASSMEVRYGARTATHSYWVALMHARSEAEGDARRTCSEDLASGYAFSCEVTTSAAGDTVVTKVIAARPLGTDGPGWGALNADEIRTGEAIAGDPSQRPIDPDEVYFLRTVESVHSETFLTSAQESVKAPTFAAAQAAWQVPVADLEEIVTDPELVIPPPPVGDNGCAWMVDADNTSCSD
jgi:hypothetical protein